MRGIRFDDQEKLLADSEAPVSDTPKHYYIQYTLIWILGVINNLAYVVILSACKALAEDFDATHLIGVLQWSNVALGVLAKLCNTLFFLESSFVTRITVTSLLMGIGLVLTAVSTQINFVVAVFGILMLGAGSALGESVMLGYLQLFNPLLTGAWSSGTGGSGVGGTLAYILLFSLLELDNFSVFMLLLPTTAMYYIAFLALHLWYGPRQSAVRNGPTAGPKGPVDPLILPAPLQLPTDPTVSGSSPLSFGGHSLLLGLSDPGPDRLLADSDAFFDGETTPTVHGGLSYRSPALPYTPTRSAASSAGQAPDVDDELDTRPRTPVLSHTGGLLGATHRVPSDLDASGPSSLSLALTTRSGRAISLSLPPPAVALAAGERSLELDSVPAAVAMTSASVALYPAADSVNSAALPPPPAGMLARIRHVMSVVGAPAVQLMMVYFFEYVISVGLAALSNPDHDSSWLSRNSYEVLAFCYQLGVMVARSSISVLRVERIEWLTLGQGLNWCLWMTHVAVQFLPLYALFPLMLWVGLFAGLMYVNVFYSITADTRLGPDKELAVNVVSIFVNVGIMLSAFFTLIADHSFFSDKHT